MTKSLSDGGLRFFQLWVRLGIQFQSNTDNQKITELVPVRRLHCQNVEYCLSFYFDQIICYRNPAWYLVFAEPKVVETKVLRNKNAIQKSEGSTVDLHDTYDTCLQCWIELNRRRPGVRSSSSCAAMTWMKLGERTGSGWSQCPICTSKRLQCMSGTHGNPWGSSHQDSVR